MASPYYSHPTYHLRQCLLVLAIVSFILGAFCCVFASYGAGLWALHLLWAFCSVLCIYDLVRYALAKARDSDAEPKWPAKKIIVGDAVLTVLFGIWYSSPSWEAVLDGMQQRRLQMAQSRLRATCKIFNRQRGLRLTTETVFYMLFASGKSSLPSKRLVG